MTTMLGSTATDAFPDLTDPRTFLDGVPLDAFARMRELPGLHWQPTNVANVHGGVWIVTRHADILAIEKDVASFTSSRGCAFPGTYLSPDSPSLDIMMNCDPPRHSRLRRAAAKGFSPRVIANFEGWVQGVVSEVLDEIQEMERFDWVVEVSQVVPTRVISRVLGLPREDEPQIVRMVTALFAALQETAEELDEGDGERDFDIDDSAQPVLEEMWAYAARIQQVKKEHPGADMFTELGQCVERGELTQQEFLTWMHLIIGAGFETTHTTISQSMRMFLEDGDVADTVHRAIDEGLGARVADEFIRHISPVMQMARVATHDLEVGGQRVRDGDVLVMYYPSANRDPAVFSEPDAFDPWRAETESLAFGSGVHRCLGANLARLQIRLLWEEIHRRRLELRLDGEPRRGWSVLINQLQSLPVRWA